MTFRDAYDTARYLARLDNQARFVIRLAGRFYVARQAMPGLVCRV